jgi:hypothetical protein
MMTVNDAVMSEVRQGDELALLAWADMLEESDQGDVARGLRGLPALLARMESRRAAGAAIIPADSQELVIHRYRPGRERRGKNPVAWTWTWRWRGDMPEPPDEIRTHFILAGPTISRKDMRALEPLLGCQPTVPKAPEAIEWLASRLGLTIVSVNYDALLIDLMKQSFEVPPDLTVVDLQFRPPAGIGSGCSEE